MSAIARPRYFETEFYAGPTRSCRLSFGGASLLPQLAISIITHDDPEGIFREIESLFSPDTVVSSRARLEKARLELLDAVHSKEINGLVDKVMKTPGVREDMAQSRIGRIHLFPEATRMVLERPTEQFKNRASIEAFMTDIDSSQIADRDKVGLRLIIPVLLDWDWSDIHMRREGSSTLVLTGNIDKAITVAASLRLIAHGKEKNLQQAWRERLEPQ